MSIASNLKLNNNFKKFTRHKKIFSYKSNKVNLPKYEATSLADSILGNATSLSLLSSSSSSLSSPSIYTIGPCASINKDHKCITCKHINSAHMIFHSNVTGKSYKVKFANNNLNCTSSNIIYLITCNKCGIQYVGETLCPLHERMNKHRSNINHKFHSLVANHFNGPCSLHDLLVQPIEQISGDGHDEIITKHRKLRESFWMKELRTVYPYGLNDRCSGKDWHKKNVNDITAKIFNKTYTYRKSRSNNKINNFSKLFSLPNFLDHVLFLYKNFDKWMYYCRKILASLSKKLCKKLFLLY